MADGSEKDSKDPFFVPVLDEKQSVEFAKRLDLPVLAMRLDDAQMSRVRQMILDELGLKDMDEVRKAFFEATCINVPNFTAVKIVAFARKEINLTFLDDAYRSWHFIRDERGKTYEVMTHAFEREVTSDEVRMHFDTLGFKGNTAAFIAWVTKYKPNGYHASVPDDDRLWRDPATGWLLVPCYDQMDEGKRKLYVISDIDLSSLCVFVAFREVVQK